MGETYISESSLSVMKFCVMMLCHKFYFTLSITKGVAHHSLFCIYYHYKVRTLWARNSKVSR